MILGPQLEWVSECQKVIIEFGKGFKGSEVEFSFKRFEKDYACA